MKRAKKPRKRDNPDFVNVERAKDAAVKMAKEVEQRATMTIFKCVYSAMAYELYGPPYNFSKAKLMKFKKDFDRKLVSAYKENKADAFLAELEDEGIDVLSLMDFDMVNLSLYFGPKQMTKIFGPGWDKEFTLADKKKLKKGWGSYQIKEGE